MKKIIALILMLALSVCALASCGAKPATLDSVKESGKLVVATSPDFPPFENLENGEVVGIEVDILKIICEELGVEMVLKTMDFNAVLTGVQAAKYDCAMSGITVNAEREENMRFTSPYYIATQCIVVKNDSAITGKADLEGKKVSAQLGTTADAACTEELGLDNVMLFNTNPESKDALMKGKVDAWVVDNLTAIQMVEESDGLKILDEAMTVEPYAFAFAYGSETLAAEMDKILKDLIADGTVESIFEKYKQDYSAPKN